MKVFHFTKAASLLNARAGSIDVACLLKVSYYSEFKVIVDERNSPGMAKGAIVRTFGICLSFNFDGVCFNYLLSTLRAEEMKLMYEIRDLFQTYSSTFVHFRVYEGGLHRICLKFVLKCITTFECYVRTSVV